MQHQQRIVVVVVVTIKHLKTKRVRERDDSVQQREHTKRSWDEKTKQKKKLESARSFRVVESKKKEQHRDREVAVFVNSKRRKAWIGLLPIKNSFCFESRRLWERARVFRCVAFRLAWFVFFLFFLMNWLFGFLVAWVLVVVIFVCCYLKKKGKNSTQNKKKQFFHLIMYYSHCHRCSSSSCSSCCCCCCCCCCW